MLDSLSSVPRLKTTGSLQGHLSLPSSLVDQMSTRIFWELVANPFIHNVEKWSDILLKSCGVNTARFLKHVWPFFNIMSEKVKSKLSPRSGTKVLKQLTSIHEKGLSFLFLTGMIKQNFISDFFLESFQGFQRKFYQKHVTSVYYC